MDARFPIHPRLEKAILDEVAEARRILGTAPRGVIRGELTRRGLIPAGPAGVPPFLAAVLALAAREQLVWRLGGDLAPGRRWPADRPRPFRNSDREA